ncbi:putative quinol monooxygenase [Hymenobacter wooponensis]|uniref:Antibiotic biosynthesis monooxygenase n=1 Tax=Hymenobacter wooponensis TaxID=1525360 RepID=A0A4Z0MTE1_9BACT|nr:putative quinol monooxygenase [Hymenobacter wooponensis]TGD82588.1 antibiotic biosynthesis monooxygenase [Hymenobacter wooponensis]
MSEQANIICVAAEWRTTPQQADNVRQLMAQAAAAVRANEPGNLLYIAHQDPKDPTHFLFYEQYADQAALDAHVASAHYQDVVVAQIVPLLTERKVNLYKLLG